METLDSLLNSSKLCFILSYFLVLKSDCYFFRLLPNADNSLVHEFRIMTGVELHSDVTCYVQNLALKAVFEKSQ